MGDLALAEVHHEASLRLARRMGSPPFEVAAEVELARTLRQRRRNGDEERVAVLLRMRKSPRWPWAYTGWRGWPPRPTDSRVSGRPRLLR